MRTLLKKRYLLVIIVFLLVGITVYALKAPKYYVSADGFLEPEWGVTFSKKYSQDLGLDWQETYIAILDDLGVNRVRIPVYWDDIEKNRGSINLDDYMHMLDEAKNRDVSVVLSIGQRLPRWPECHTPDWYDGLQAEEKEEALFNMLEVVVKSFVEYENIIYWQVENEPLVRWFGECPSPNRNLVAREIKFVKTFDTRPIMVTDSGELGFWKGVSKLGGDFVGITTYRVTWNKWLKFIRYPFPTEYYRTKAFIVGIPWENVIIAELQAEPWIPGTKGITETSLETQYRSMSLEQFKANIDYARAMHVSEAYLWGVEWWYWLKKRGTDSIWNEAKLLWN